jgi:hypothetical protein
MGCAASLPEPAGAGGTAGSTGTKAPIAPTHGNPGPFPHVIAVAGHATLSNTKNQANLPNEDRSISEQILRAVYMYSVMDGHKGPMCADFLSDKLHEYIKKQPGMEVLADELRDPRQALVVRRVLAVAAYPFLLPTRACAVDSGGALALVC